MNRDSEGIEDLIQGLVEHACPSCAESRVTGTLPCAHRRYRTPRRRS